jgi:hypothetical protein
MEKEIENLVKRASEATSGDDAMRYSQAACNVANALRALADARATNTKTGDGSVGQSGGKEP